MRQEDDRIKSWALTYLVSGWFMGAILFGSYSCYKSYEYKTCRPIQPDVQTTQPETRKLRPNLLEKKSEESNTSTRPSKDELKGQRG